MRDHTAAMCCYPNPQILDTQWRFARNQSRHFLHYVPPVDWRVPFDAAHILLVALMLIVAYL